MDFLNNIFKKTVAENEKNIRIWEDYINKLQALDFSIYADKLKVPVLVPIGNRMFFRGELKHTNEVTVALGADYFIKCSLKQAIELKQHRINIAQEKLDKYQNERDYLENQRTFSNKIVSAKQARDIVEYQTEEEDRIWRVKHRENCKKFKQKRSNDVVEELQTTHEELWNRLDELEIQEDLENEMLEGRDVNKEEYMDSIVVTEESIFKNISKLPSTSEDLDNTQVSKYENEPIDDESSCKPASKYDLLQKVLDKQNELEEKLIELRNNERRGKSKTEKDLLSRLDEMEQLDDLEDEMDRLDDILQTNVEDSKEEENVDDSKEEETSIVSQAKIKRGVSFADEDDSKTLEITFKHSIVEPSNERFDSKKGIQKPSDFYDAHSNLFIGATSILKKKHFVDRDSNVELPKVERKHWVVFEEDDEEENLNNTIVVKDVVEKEDTKDNKLDNVGARPTSLFKKRRQQMKS